MTAESKEARFVGLDGLRGVAAIFVLGQHVPDPTLRTMFPYMGLAVDLFFVLSGFVLAHAYEQKLSGGMTTLKFMRIRLVRLYPLYILGTAITIGLVLVEALGARAIDKTTFVGSIAAALVFLPCPTPFNFSPPLLYPLNPPAWSLFYELAINVAFAVAAVRRWSVAIMLGVGMLFTVATIAAFGTLEVGWETTTFLGGFGRTTLPFFVGVGLYQLWKADRIRWLKTPSWVPIVALVAVFSMPFQDGWVRPAFYAFASVFILPLIVTAGANAPPAKLFARTCVVLGTASYAFYVLQVPMVSALDAIARALGYEVGAFGFVGTLALAAIIFPAALLADAIYDTPVRRWLGSKRTIGRAPA